MFHVEKSHPKLKQAMEEIKTILKKHDLGASVVLHTPGFVEYLNKIDPTYSCARIKEGGILIRANLKENFNGDREAQQRCITDTANMFHMLAVETSRTAVTLIEVSDLLDKISGAEHF